MTILYVYEGTAYTNTGCLVIYSHTVSMFKRCTMGGATEGPWPLNNLVIYFGSLYFSLFMTLHNRWSIDPYFALFNIHYNWNIEVK